MFHWISIQYIHIQTEYTIDSFLNRIYNIFYLPTESTIYSIYQKFYLKHFIKKDYISNDIIR
jgi:patatin-like phospholipase/acyl hydrolase